MPKIFESKIVLTADTSDADRKVDKFQEKLKNTPKVAQVAGVVGEQLDLFGTGFPTRQYGGKAGGGGSPRSPYAPPPGVSVGTRELFEARWAEQERRMQERARIAGEKFAASPYRGLAEQWAARQGAGAGTGRRGKFAQTREFGELPFFELNLRPPPPPPPPPPWMKRLFTTGPEAMMGMAQGPGGLAGLLRGGAGILGAGGVGILAAAGGLAAIAAAVMHATSLAERSMAIERNVLPLYYRMAGGREQIQQAMRFGAGYGYAPEEVAQFLPQLERIGAYEAFQPFARLRYRGMEMQELMPFIQTATTMGAAGTRTEKEYEKLAKLIAIQFASKGLPSISQALEQLTSITQSQGSYLADVTDEQLGYLAALVRAGEESPTAMLRGARGAQTWATVQAAMAGTQDPGHLMMIYSTLSRNPDLRAKVLNPIYGREMGGAALTPFRAQMIRESPEALLAMLQGYTRGGDLETGAMMLYDLFGGKLSATQTFQLAKIAGSVGTNVERFQQEAAKKGIDLKDIEGRKLEADWRQRDAEMKLNIYNAGVALTTEVVNLKNNLAQLNLVLVPILQGVLIPLNAIANVIGIFLPGGGGYRTPGEGSAYVEKFRQETIGLSTGGA